MICAALLALNLLVDKFHGLPANFRPPDLVKVESVYLRSEAAAALEKMLAVRPMKINSAYRSSPEQNQLYFRGNLTAAPPDYSEHQLGTAVDLKVKYPSKDWTWLDHNAHKFGWVMSYRYNQQTRTGYAFEPWHWRYVGIPLATQIRYSYDLPQSFYRPAACL